MFKNKSFVRKGFGVVLALAVFVATTLALIPTDAQALRVSLKRVIFEGRSRSQVITVINNTEEEQTYRLGWRRYRMTEHKMLETIKEGEDPGNVKAADPYLRYAPRRITLGPGQSQQVRIMARVPKSLEAGEYRSHLWISPEAKPPKFTPQEMDEAKTKPVVKISMLTGLTMPVFIRHGDLPVKGSISDVKVSKGAEGFDISMVLNREGGRSLYGDIDFICIGGGNELIIKQSRGIAVYEEVSRRFVDFRVPYPEGGAGACQQMRIVYFADPEDPQYEGGVIAKAEVNP